MFALRYPLSPTPPSPPELLFLRASPPQPQLNVGEVTQVKAGQRRERRCPRAPDSFEAATNSARGSLQQISGQHHRGTSRREMGKVPRSAGGTDRAVFPSHPTARSRAERRFGQGEGEKKARGRRRVRRGELLPGGLARGGLNPPLPGVPPDRSPAGAAPHRPADPGIAPLKALRQRTARKKKGGKPHQNALSH